VNYQLGDYLQSKRPISTQFRYEVVSQPENRESTLPPTSASSRTRPPTIVSPRVRALVEAWKKEHTDPARTG